jgi:hypothetical protein
MTHCGLRIYFRIPGVPGLHFVPWHRGIGCLGASAPVTGAAADEHNLDVVDCASVTVPRLSSIPVLKWGSGGYPQLWTLEWVVRGNVGIHRARKVIQVDGSRPRRVSWQGFPGSSLSGTLASYGASAVARTSGRGHVAEE